MASHTVTMPADKIWRSGFTLVSMALLALVLSKAATAIPLPIPGDFDFTFAAGTGKIANLAIGATKDRAFATALQSDGKIVLAGECSNATNNDFCVARLNADGSLDASFTGPGGFAAGKFMLPIGTGDDSARGIAIQPDGKIVLVGTCHNGVNNDFCIARLNPNGSRDSSFIGPGGGGNGLFLLSIGGSEDSAAVVALQPDGKILLAGSCYNVSDYDFCAVRLNANGTFDTSFVGPGGNGNGKFLLPIGLKHDYATAMVVQSDGKIVLAGYCLNAMNDQDFCAARLKADGSFDTGFSGPSGSGNGKFLLPVGNSSDYASSALLQPDGNIVLTGFCINGAGYDFCAVRLLAATGSLDSSFAGPTGNGNGKIMLPIGVSSDNSLVAALQPDGKILLAGYCVGAVNNDFCVARLNSDGTFDTTFDGPGVAGNGKFIFPVSNSDDIATAMAIQPDGKIVVVGYCGNGVIDSFCVTRLNGGPFGYKSCTMDIDGDGSVLATTDALMLARVAMGMTGAAVTNGAVGAVAKRTTWAQIRSYLVDQCGMSLAP